MPLSVSLKEGSIRGWFEIWVISCWPDLDEEEPGWSAWSSGIAEGREVGRLFAEFIRLMFVSFCYANG